MRRFSGLFSAVPQTEKLIELYLTNKHTIIFPFPILFNRQVVHGKILLKASLKLH